MTFKLKSDGRWYQNAAGLWVQSEPIDKTLVAAASTGQVVAKASDGKLELITPSAGGGAFSGASVRHDADQSLSNNTVTTLAFNTEDYDEGGYHDTATNNSRLTAPATGKYVASANVEFDVNGTGIRRLQLLKNGTDILCRYTWAAFSTFGGTVGFSTPPIDLAEDDYVELQAVQTSGGNLDVNFFNGQSGFTTFFYSPLFSLHKVG